MTRGEKVIAFIEAFCVIPEGNDVGKPIKLAPFQKKFITDIYDNKHGTRRAIMTIARKNGKSALIAALLLCHICGTEAKKNTQIVSGAMSRDQAALVFNLAAKMINLSPELNKVTRIIPSQKKIVGLAMNVEYRALAADSTTAHGLSPVLAIMDEVGQVQGASSPFIDAILTSQGAYQDALQIFISTQAPSDADFLSIMVDDAIRSGDKKTVCHVYEAQPDCELLDKKQWKKANPGLGLFRSETDLAEQLKQASRLPSMEASARNLLLNQRVALESLWLA
ncbi:MAG: terminase large subunit, partial [Betaproteobacteria bacterium]